MRKSVIATLVVAVALLVGAGVLYSEPNEPDGLPNVSGPWVGKVKVKGFDMTGQDDGWKDKGPAVAKMSQMGSALQATVDVEDGPRFEMRGLIGDGHFWLTGEGEDGLVVWFGHVKSKGKKLVGKIFVAEDTQMIEGTIQVKRPKDLK